MKVFQVFAAWLTCMSSIGNLPYLHLSWEYRNIFLLSFSATWSSTKCSTGTTVTLQYWTVLFHENIMKYTVMSVHIQDVKISFCPFFLVFVPSEVWHKGHGHMYWSEGRWFFHSDGSFLFILLLQDATLSHHVHVCISLWTTVGSINMFASGFC